MPITPCGSYTNSPRFVFIAGLECGTRSARNTSIAWRAENSAESCTTSTSAPIASGIGLPDSRLINSATSRQRSFNSLRNRRIIAIRPRTPKRSPRRLRPPRRFHGVMHIRHARTSVASNHLSGSRVRADQPWNRDLASVAISISKILLRALRDLLAPSVFHTAKVKSAGRRRRPRRASRTLP